MSRALLILRPEPGNGDTVARADAMGLGALSCPLFAVVPVAWDPPPPERFDGVLFTSANALRYAGPTLADYTHLPAHAVGAATADAARNAGFAHVTVGAGDVTDLLALVGGKKMLHLCGADIVDPPVATLDRRIVYASLVIDSPAEMECALSTQPVAVLHSARAARRFAELVDQSQTPRGLISLAAISAKVAQAAGTGWQEVAIAGKPSDEQLLQAAARLIQQIKAQAFS